MKETSQQNSTIQNYKGLVEIMQRKKEEKLAKGEEVYTNFENTKRNRHGLKETIKH